MTDFNDGRAKRARTDSIDASAPHSRGTTPVAMRHARRKRSRRLAVTLSIIGGLVVVLAVAGGWLGSRVLNAKASLESAQALVGTVKDQATSMDFAGIGESSIELSQYTADAVAQTEDPVWRAAELIPFAGKNLSVVRKLAVAVDSVAQDTVAPLASVASTLSIESLKPVDGRLNIEPIKQLAAAMGPAATALDATTKSIQTLDVGGTIGQVSSAGTMLKDMLPPVNELLASANTVLAVAPDMLGASGPRSYLLIFQNLAEATALGGTSAALSEVVVDNGAISVARQASSADFPWRDGDPVIPEDPNLAALYEPQMYTRLNLATSRPDFPTAAIIAKAFWEQKLGGTVDGVISVDPAALGRILGVTGPVAMSTGDVLTAENVVPLLLNEIYFRYQGEDGPTQTDAFFEEAAKTMFSALMSTTAAPKDLLWAVNVGIEENRIMAWSAHAAEQELIAPTTLSGILPTTNDDSTLTGVFFRDMSASKMSYYLQTAAKLTTDVCTAESPTFATEVTLHSNITAEQADALPAYIASGMWGGEQFQTQVFIYGPPGTALTSNSIDVQGVRTSIGQTTDDLGRPVISFWVVLAPGESSTVTATFSGSAGEYAAPALRATPMINATTLTIDAPGCSTAE